MMDHGRRNARGVGRPAGGKFIAAADVMDGYVRTKAHHTAAAAILDQIIAVGEPANEWNDLD
jgi:hypothetical protein